MTADDPLIQAIVETLGGNESDEALSRARAVYDAIAATGRLLPDGGTTEVQHRYRVAGITTIGLSTEQIHDGDEWRLSDRRTVTHWPDDRWHFAPWEAVDGQ